jgi:hypothetical protein
MAEDHSSEKPKKHFTLFGDPTWSATRTVVERLYLIFTVLSFALLIFFGDFINSRMKLLFVIVFIVTGNLAYYFSIWWLGDEIDVISLLSNLLSSWRKKSK